MRSALGSVLLCALAMVSEASEFEFVVTYDGERMGVECRSGCSIPILPPRLSGQQQCLPGHCSVTVRDDSMSISSGGSPTDGGVAIMSSSDLDPRFEIRLSPTETDVNARCSTGCSWQQESFACPAMPCVATIDDVGIRLGDVAETRSDSGEAWMPNQDTRRRWINCLVGYLVKVRFEGGPIGFPTAREEAQVVCSEHRADWDALVEESGLSAVEAEKTLDELMRTAWETELPEARQ